MRRKSIAALLSSKVKERVGPSFTKEEMRFIQKEHEKYIQNILRSRLKRDQEVLKGRSASPESINRIFHGDTRVPERFQRPSQPVSPACPPADAVTFWSMRTRTFDMGSAPMSQRLLPPNEQLFTTVSAAHPAVGGLSVEAAVGQKRVAPALSFPGAWSIGQFFVGNSATANVMKYLSFPEEFLPAFFCATAHIDISVGGVLNATGPCGQGLGRTDIGPYDTTSTGTVLGEISVTLGYGGAGTGLPPQATYLFLRKEANDPAVIDDRSFDLTAPTVLIPRLGPGFVGNYAMVDIDASAHAIVAPTGDIYFAGMDYTGDFEPPGWIWPGTYDNNFYGKICIELSAWLYKPRGWIANLPPGSL